MSTTVQMAELPACSFCPETAAYDGATRMGPWAYMCPRHFALVGLGHLGTGVGQRLTLARDAEGCCPHGVPGPCGICDVPADDKYLEAS
jgi:hypothetical protein